MGIGAFSDSELKVLSEKFSAINGSLTAVESNLQSQIGEIKTKLSSLKDTGTTILDEPTIKGMFDKVKNQFAESQSQLTAQIEEFRTAAAAYEAKQKEQLEQEEELIKRESQADASFADKHKRLVAPVKRYMEALEAKEHELVRMQEEYIAQFQKREQELVEEFEQLKAQQNAAFDSEMQKLNAAREEVASRESAVSDREKDVATREIEVRQGLTQERSAMMADIEVERNHLQEEKDALVQAQDKLKEERSLFETEKGELQSRIDSVYERERQADEGFADKRNQMQEDIEKLRKGCLKQIHAEEEKASAKRAELLEKTIAQLDEERTRALAALNEELTKVRQDAEAKIAEERAALQAEREALSKEKAEIASREAELKERELGIRVEEDRQKQEKAFLAEKMRIDEEKFRKMAAEEIAAATEVANAAQKSRDELSKKLKDLWLKFEEQKAINDRFEYKSPEEIYAMISALEVENDRLKTEYNDRLKTEHKALAKQACDNGRKSPNLPQKVDAGVQVTE